MPEYLSPGVYVEEVSFRSKSIEGVPTSTTGFAGMAHFGPVHYTYGASNEYGPKSSAPRLITSFTEFERVYGGLDPLQVGETGADERLPYLGHAARAFFDNGGKRLYISRVFVPRTTDPKDGVASLAVTLGEGTNTATATWRARWPGRAGNVRVTAEVIRSRNIAFAITDPDDNAKKIAQARRVRPGAVVEVIASGPAPVGSTLTGTAQLRVVEIDGEGFQTFFDESGNTTALAHDVVIQLLELRVRVEAGRERRDEYSELSTSAAQRRYVGRVLQKDDPADEDCMVWLKWAPDDWTTLDAKLRPFIPAQLLYALVSEPTKRLTGGHDGLLAQPDDLAGKEANPDDVNIKATGLAAIGEIDDIAIVALPDAATYDDDGLCTAAVGALLAHVTNVPYRIAIVDAPRESSLNEVREFRGRFDSSHAALYHPWLEVLDPNERPSGGPPRLLSLPPSGAVAGVYARTDVARGVHKAPANEIIQGLVRFESNITQARQDVLNPEGVNALRALERRGNRIWGARTMSSDPEWKYVNVRRIFNYLAHSIDRGTQWAVFEPNNRRLWDSIRRSIEDFLRVMWRDGALLGDTEKEAFFVTCDRTTMTQNDLDNGRLICFVGVAPVTPAEFVILRIGQWTADAKL
ncbi:phage tail sheath C-terminal domain-containing protein [Nannocystis sp.]|uniref:phage tail sheath family protein n=1 Tax=Nannocystis sp. TaxID=1962667 RepID=UPI0025F7E46D|nr:phage tail sheath C-terminal domain-containing protein [Nannocystis sp.]MBK7823667.1 phage tail sheath family protein [Nannocystis sp.]